MNKNYFSNIISNQERKICLILLIIREMLKTWQNTIILKKLAISKVVRWRNKSLGIKWDLNWYNSIGLYSIQFNLLKLNMWIFKDPYVIVIVSSACSLEMLIYIHLHIRSTVPSSTVHTSKAGNNQMSSITELIICKHMQWLYRSKN